MYDGPIELLKSPRIKVDDLLELIYSEVAPSIGDRRGIDAITHGRKTWLPYWPGAKMSELTSAEKLDFAKLLDKLPPLHGYMDREEVQAFQHAYFRLPERLDWYPGIWWGIQGPLIGLGCLRKRWEIELHAWPEALTPEDKQELKKLLPKLPVEPHGRMSDSEIAEFLEAYRALPERLSWEPMLRDEDVYLKEFQWMESRKAYEVEELNRLIASGEINIFSIDHGRKRFYDRFIEAYISSSDAAKYLRIRGLFDVFEHKFNPACPAVASVSAERMQVSSSPIGPIEEPTALSAMLSGKSFAADTRPLLNRLIIRVEDMKGEDQIKSAIVKAMRELKTYDKRAIFDWFHRQALHSPDRVHGLTGSVSDNPPSVACYKGRKVVNVTEELIGRRIREWMRPLKERGRERGV